MIGVINWDIVLENVWEAFVAIAAVGTVFVTVRRMRMENTAQHDDNKHLLRHVAEQVVDLGHQLTHLHQKVDDNKAMLDRLVDDVEDHEDDLEKLFSITQAVQDVRLDVLERDDPTSH